MKSLKALLLAVFLAAFSSPALATTYFFKGTGSDANDCLSDANACQNISKVNAGTYSPGDIIQFKRGDPPVSDAILNLNQAGTAGNPITIQAYDSGARPVVGSTSLLRAFDVDVAFITVDGVNFSGSSGASNTTGLINVTAANFTLTNSDVTGATAAGGSIACILMNSATDYALSNGSVADCNSTGVQNSGSSSGTITDWTFGDHAQSTAAQGDQLNGQSSHTGTVTCTRCTFDANDNVKGENGIDAKGSGTWTIDDSEFIDSRQSCILVGDAGTGGTSQVTINDSYIHCDGGGRDIQLGVSDDDTNVLTLNRTRVVCLGGSTECVFVRGSVTPDTVTLNLNAVTFETPTGATDTRTLQISDDSVVVARNSTFIARNGNTLGEIIFVQSDYDGAGITSQNNIFDTDCTTCFIYESDVVDPFTNDQNLYESGATNWIDINGTTYTEATLISTYDTSGSTTGDPLFASEVETSDIYLMLLPGSPGIGLGDPANLYATPATDLLGYRFNGTTPNAGARSQRIQLKAPGRMMQ